MEAEESGAGRMSKGDGTQTPLLTEQMATRSNSCPAQDTEPRRGTKAKTPGARTRDHFEIADILFG